MVFLDRFLGKSNSEGDDTVDTTDTRTKSILRKNRQLRNKNRNVSWSQSFETREPDYTFEDEADDDERDDASLIRDFNFIYNGESLYTYDDTLQDNATYESLQDDATFESMSDENTTFMVALSTSQDGDDGAVEAKYSTSQTDYAKLACASSVSDATLNKDKYGLENEERDPSSRGDEPNANHGVDGSSGVFVPTEALPVNAEFHDEFMDAPSLDTDSITITSVTSQDNESLDLNDNSFDNQHWVERRVNSDDSIVSLKKNEHGFQDLFNKQNKADSSHGHIGLILPFMKRFNCGAFMDEKTVFSWDMNALKKEFGLKENKSDGSKESPEKGGISGLEHSTDNDDDKKRAEDACSGNQGPDAEATCETKGVTEVEATTAKVSKRSIEEFDIQDRILVENCTSQSEDVQGSVDESAQEHSEANSTQKNEEQSVATEKSSHSSEGDEASAAIEKSSHKSEGDEPTSVEDEDDSNIDDDDEMSNQIGHVIAIEQSDKDKESAKDTVKGKAYKRVNGKWVALTDESIPSNSSIDGSAKKKAKKKTRLKPLSFLRKRLFRKKDKTTQQNLMVMRSKSIVSSESYLEYEDLHTQVYQGSIPDVESCYTTESILNELQIIENTAKAMYQERFMGGAAAKHNGILTLFNPDGDDEIAQTPPTSSEQKEATPKKKNHSKLNPFAWISNIFFSKFNCDSEEFIACDGNNA